jgi:hypothetical protein
LTHFQVPMGSPLFANDFVLFTDRHKRSTQVTAAPRGVRGVARTRTCRGACGGSPICRRGTMQLCPKAGGQRLCGPSARRSSGCQCPGCCTHLPSER